MRQFQIHVVFDAVSEKDARDLSRALELMVSVFCHRDPWSLHTEEEGNVYEAGGPARKTTAPRPAVSTQPQPGLAAHAA